MKATMTDRGTGHGLALGADRARQAEPQARQHRAVTSGRCAQLRRARRRWRRRITPEEMAGHMQARFEGADADGDGVLSREELVTRMMERRAERMGAYADHMIDRYDADGDGMLGDEKCRPGVRAA